MASESPATEVPQKMPGMPWPLSWLWTSLLGFSGRHLSKKALLGGQTWGMGRRALLAKQPGEHPRAQCVEANYPVQPAVRQ